MVPLTRFVSVTSSKIFQIKIVQNNTMAKVNIHILRTLLLLLSNTQNICFFAENFSENRNSLQINFELEQVTPNPAKDGVQGYVRIEIYPKSVHDQYENSLPLIAGEIRKRDELSLICKKLGYKMSNFIENPKKSSGRTEEEKITFSIKKSEACKSFYLDILDGNDEAISENLNVNLQNVNSCKES